MSLLSWAASDVGLKRKANEDSFFHSSKLGLFMVADGMGGHKAGAHASSLAVKTCSFEIVKELKGTKLPKELLKNAVLKAGQRVFREGESDESLRGMGTTLSVLLIKDKRVFISHVGDSRVYCFRDKKLKQLTLDHSLVGEQVKAGVLSPEEARVSNLRNVITNAIGHKEQVKPDVYEFTPKNEDTYLLCSDGLNSMVREEDIEQILSTFHPCIAVEKLIKAANDAGGDDNTTCILVSFMDE